MNVGKRISEFRIAKNYTVNKLANMAGISQSYLRDIELGNKNPTIATLEYICDALDVTLKEFFTDNTAEKITQDPLLERIYQMTQEQRNSLLHFLNTLD